jgi:hypothetical protein
MQRLLTWAAAMLAAAAVGTPIAVVAVFAATAPTTRTIAAVAAVALVGGVWLLVRLRGRAVVAPFAAGAIAVWGLVAAGVVASLALVGTDACGSEPAQTIGWVGFAVLYLGGGAWALHAGRRAFWALPLAFTLAAAWLIGLAAAFPGPGGCGD